jgi:hypothetical protein
VVSSRWRGVRLGRDPVRRLLAELNQPESRAWHIVERGIGGAKFTITDDQADPFSQPRKTMAAVS